MQTIKHAKIRVVRFNMWRKYHGSSSARFTIVLGNKCGSAAVIVRNK